MNRPGRRRRDDAARPSRGDRKRASTTAWADPRKAATCQKTKTSNVAGRASGRQFVFVWLCRGERRPDVAGVGRALRTTRAHAVGCDGRVARRRQARGGRARGGHTARAHATGLRAPRAATAGAVDAAAWSLTMARAAARGAIGWAVVSARAMEQSRARAKIARQKRPHGRRRLLLREPRPRRPPRPLMAAAPPTPTRLWPFLASGCPWWSLSSSRLRFC